MLDFIYRTFVGQIAFLIKKVIAIQSRNLFYEQRLLSLTGHQGHGLLHDSWDKCKFALL